MPEKAKDKKFYSRKGKLSDVTINTESAEVVKHFVRTYSYKKKRNQIKARGSVYHSFYRELECLKRLQGHENFPQLIDYDEDQMWIKMSYCGEPYPAHILKNNKQLVPQVDKIVSVLEKQKILYPYERILSHRKDITAEFPVHNLHYKDGKIYLIDFEMSLPLDSGYADYFGNRFTKMFDRYDNNVFRELLHRVVYPGKTAEVPDDELEAKWLGYESSNSNSVADRIEKFQLKKFGGDGKTLLDIGAGKGEFVKTLSDYYCEVTAVEPFISRPTELPSNVKWHSSGYKKFVDENTQQFDLVLCLCASLQITDIDILDEITLAKTLSKLVNPDGVLVLETTKQVKYDNYRTHVQDMLGYLKRFMGRPIEVGNVAKKGGRMYYVYKKTP